jgi:hypothetical protein
MVERATKLVIVIIIIHLLGLAPAGYLGAPPQTAIWLCLPIWREKMSSEEFPTGKWVQVGLALKI